MVEDFVHEGYRLKRWAEAEHGRMKRLETLLKLGRTAVYKVYGDEVVEEKYKSVLKEQNLFIEGVTAPLKVIPSNTNENEILRLEQIIESQKQTIESQRQLIEALQAAVRRNKN